MTRILSFIVLLLGLTACASSPLKLEGVDRSLSPAMVSTAHPHSGQRVAWGGVIMRTEPQAQQTRIEVLAYPLDRYGAPDAQSASQGRFLLLHPGYLEPADYAPGRWISAVGQIGQPQTGKIGEASYTFPVLEAEQLHLWPADSGSRTSTHFHFGIGIRF